MIGVRTRARARVRVEFPPVGCPRAPVEAVHVALLDRGVDSVVDAGGIHRFLNPHSTPAAEGERVRKCAQCAGMRV